MTLHPFSLHATQRVDSLDVNARGDVERTESLRDEIKTRVPSMLTYRCYLLDESGGIKDFVEVSAFDDSDAIKEVRQNSHLASRMFEVWRGVEMIYRNA